MFLLLLLVNNALTVEKSTAEHSTLCSYHDKNISYKIYHHKLTVNVNEKIILMKIIEIIFNLTWMCIGVFTMKILSLSNEIFSKNLFNGKMKSFFRCTLIIVKKD